MFWVIIFGIASVMIDCSYGNGNTDLDVESILEKQTHMLIDVESILEKQAHMLIDVESILEKQAHMLTELKEQIDTVNIKNTILVERMNAPEEENQLIKSKLANVKCSVPCEKNKAKPNVLVYNNGSEEPSVTTQPGPVSDDAATDGYGSDEPGSGGVTKLNAPDDSKLPLTQPHSIRRDIRSLSGSKVGFYATILQVGFGDLGGYETVRFDNVITNVGNGYNKTHGIFTAPANGMYSISAIVRVMWDSTAYLIMRKNGDDICIVYKDSKETTAACTAVVPLNEGDNVYVQNSNDAVSRVMGYGYSSFSGFLI